MKTRILGDHPLSFKLSLIKGQVVELERFHKENHVRELFRMKILFDSLKEIEKELKPSTKNPRRRGRPIIGIKL